MAVSVRGAGSFERMHAWLARSSVPRLMRAGAGSGPDFLCVGMQKGGTQWLYDQLRSHPDFWMPPIKELHYFDRGPRERRNLRRSRRFLSKVRNWNYRDLAFFRAAAWISWRDIDLDEYARLFDLKGRRLSGDITPGYSTLDESTIEAIVKHFPGLKVVLFIRDPVDRFWSAFSMGVRGNKLKLTTADDWDQIREIVSRPDMRARSYPSEIAARWRRFVPSERFAVYFFDDLAADPAGLRDRIIRFLGADPGEQSVGRAPSFNRKALDIKQPMSETIRARLAEHFAGELRACADAFGGPARKWPARYGL